MFYDRGLKQIVDLLARGELLQRGGHSPLRLHLFDEVPPLHGGEHMATIPMSVRLTPRERDAVRRLEGVDPAWLADRDKRAAGPALVNGGERPSYLGWLLARALRDAEERVDAAAELEAELDQQVADDPSVEPDDVDYSDRDVVLAAVSGRWGAIACAEAGDLKTVFLARMLRGEFPDDAETTWPQVRGFARDADRFVPPGDARRPAS